MVNPYVAAGLIGGTVVAAALLTALAWRQRPQPGATAFAVVMAGGTWWGATSSVGLFTTDATVRLALHTLEWPGMVVIPMGWLLFTLSYTSRDAYVTRRNAALLAVVPLVTLALVVTNEFHTLVYANRTVTVYDTISLIDRTYGPWYWVWTSYTYALLAVAAMLIVQFVVGLRSVYRGQAIALLIAILAPWAGHVVFLTSRSPVPEFDVTPFAFLISGVIGLAALRQFKLFEAVPVSPQVARHSVVESMRDGVIVIDREDTIVDANPRATRILDCERDDVLDRPATTVVPAYDSLRAGGESASETVEIDRHNGTRYYEVTMSGLFDAHGRKTGHVVVIHDVTDRRNRVQQLDVLNRVLRHNLRNEMTVIYGYADRLDQPEVESRIKERAQEMVDLGEKAREIDQVLDGEGLTETTSLSRIVDIETDTVDKSFEDVTITVSGPGDDVEIPYTYSAVLRNLVENAAEHNTSDEPKVRVDVCVEDETVVTEVRDNGPGIPEEETIVLRDGEETPLKHSSGLGLWLVNWGAERMGGSVSVDRTPKAETVVRVTVPTARARTPLPSD